MLTFSVYDVNVGCALSFSVVYVAVFFLGGDKYLAVNDASLPKFANSLPTTSSGGLGSLQTLMEAPR